jgi:hypothetical protein
MQTGNWLNHVKESFAAIAAGGRIVPMGDNGELQRSLASKLAELRTNAALGRVRPWPGSRGGRRASLEQTD